NGDDVPVDAVNATSCDLPAKQARMLDLDAFAQRTERVIRGCPQPVEFGRDLRYWTFGEQRRKPRLNAVNCGDQEVPGTHREVNAAEVEKCSRRLSLLAGVKEFHDARDVLVERWLKGVRE